MNRRKRRAVLTDRMVAALARGDFGEPRTWTRDGRVSRGLEQRGLVGAPPEGWTPRALDGDHGEDTCLALTPLGLERADAQRRRFWKRGEP